MQWHFFVTPFCQDNNHHFDQLVYNIDMKLALVYQKGLNLSKCSIISYKEFFITQCLLVYLFHKKTPYFLTFKIVFIFMLPNMT